MSIVEHKPFDERKYTPLEQFRRSELRAMAKKWCVDVDLEGKKSEMLPIMELAKSRGVFDRPPPVVEPPKPKEYTVTHLGVAFKWCVMDGDTIHEKGFDSKNEALASVA